jgi:aspartyl-tRNA(Asn)/glutamyl-tRNA(Gln) amidotransferase subunit A
MYAMNIHELTISDALIALNQRQMSANELVSTYIERIFRYNNRLQTFITVSEQALELANLIDEKRQKGEMVGPMAGIPIAVKDLFDTQGMQTTYGGRHFKDYYPTESATAVRRLEEAGAIIIGKTNLHEYAYGTTSENPHFGSVSNPWNTSKIAGGSSGGSSVAIVTDMALGALGTDTGGSIRIPAALTGHVGLKPTYGLVSKFGAFPLAPTLDHVGPMTKSVNDATLLMQIIAGYDPKDPHSARTPARVYSEKMDLSNIRLGVPKNYFFEQCDPSVNAVMTRVLQQLETWGFRLAEVDVKLADRVPEMQGAVIASEASNVHERLLSEKPDLYGSDVRHRLELGSQVSGPDYVKAMTFRRAFRSEVVSLYPFVDALVTPTSPLPATDIGQTKTVIGHEQIRIRSHLTRYTNPWNLSGLPALSIPCGLTKEGLPVGLQLVGAPFSDAKLLTIGAKIEERIQFQARPTAYC